MTSDSSVAQPELLVVGMAYLTFFVVVDACSADLFKSRVNRFWLH